MDYVSIFRKAAFEHSSSTALVDLNGSRRTSYAELDALSESVALSLHQQGCRKGDFIIIDMGRSRNYLAAYLGVLKAGCVVVPLIPEYPAERVAFIRGNCSAKLTIDDDFFLNPPAPAPCRCTAADGIASDAPAVLAYTSGSTGTPKGLLFSTGDICRSAARHAFLFDGLSRIDFASAAQLSFLLHIFEYFAVFPLGGTVHILPDEVRKSAAALNEYYCRNGITVGSISPQMLRLFRNSSPSLELVITCGERLTKTGPDGYRLVNGYGLSETLVFVTTFEVDRAYDNTPIGKGMESLEVMVLDENGNKAPDGVEGEICVLGHFDTEYYKDPVKTAEKLCPQSDGRTLVHTSDIGYVGDGGNLIYTNRLDWMVKVNGQRVETLEIENVLTDLPDVRNAAVKAFEDEDGQNYLVAYAVIDEDADGNSVTDDDIRDALARKLPWYMIPRFIVRMEELPKNLNGKLNRNALLPPEAGLYKKAYCAPADNTEKCLCEAFEAVLHCGIVGAADDFISLGGDSIKAIRLVSVASISGLAPETVIAERTPRRIAAACAASRADAVEHLKEIPEVCPLSDSQTGVYLDCISSLNSVKYNIPFVCSLPSGIDAGKVKAAVAAVVDLYPVLKVTISEEGGRPVMRHSHRETEVGEMKVDDIYPAAQGLVRPFNLENGPLYRFVLLHCGEDLALFADIHHIVFDGSSVTVLVNRIADALCGKVISLKEEHLTAFDIATADTQIRTTDRYARAREYFRNILDGVECDSAPVADILTEEAEQGAGHITIDADGIDMEEVARFTKESSVTENTLFLGAFAYALARFNADRECLFCTVDNGRHDTRLEDSVGMFVRTVPFHYEFDDSKGIRETLSEIQNLIVGAISNDCISFSELASQYGFGMNVSFVYQGDMFSGASTAGGDIGIRMLDTDDIQSDIHFMMYRSEGHFRLNVGYRRKSYSKALASALAEMFLKVIRDMLSAASFSEITFVGSRQKELVGQLNRTETPYEDKLTVVAQFRRQAASTPDGPCLVFADKSFTYAEVDDISDRLAGELVSRGIGKGDVVAILIPRCEHMLTASLGVLKSGAAYMPLDPTYPSERLNLMVRDSGAALLLATKDLSGLIDDGFKGIRMDAGETGSLPASRVSLPEPSPEDSFVLLYTSGSTGTPKGVQFRHSNTMVTAAWQKRFYGLAPGCNVAAYASYGFDANVFDTYATIISGATLHIISEDMRLDLPALREYFNANGITHATMTTQVGRQFALMKDIRTLKFLNLAGEKLTPVTPPSGFTLMNLYGPTEGSILASGFAVDRLYRDIPIGKAVDNVKLYVVDSRGRLLPPGASGELWISGPHVTAGYLNRPEKTAEAYGENPFCGEAGYERVYRTGDIVRMLDDGTLQFIGRRDGQVKVRGFRIELTEVEEVIRRFEGIRDATVAAFDDPSGGKYIAAYVVSDTEVDVDKLNSFIRSVKPPYMVPAVTMQIDAIPLNQNQKVNRRALPVPERKRSDAVQPETETQRRIYDIASEILGHTAFGIDSDLFEAGLTSIGVLRMNVAIAEAFGISIRTDELRQCGTIRSLESRILSSGSEEALKMQDDYPITQTQMGIFIEWSSNPDSVNYNIPLLVKLGKNVDVQRLADAVRKAIDAHPYIKTTLTSDSDGNIWARRNDALKAEVTLIRTDEIPSAGELVRPFNLLGDALYRAAVYVTDKGSCLFLDFNHIIADGTSEAILLSDIDKAYEGVELETEAFSGFEAALAENRDRGGERFERARAYYDGLLKGNDAASLPPSSALKGESGAASAERVCSLGAGKVLSFCEANHLTANAFFTSLFGYVLKRFGNQDETIFTTVYNGRSDSRLSGAFTMLVKTLPVLVRDTKGKGTVDYIRGIQQQLLDSMANDIFSFADISENYGVKADVIFVYQGDSFNFNTLCGERSDFITLLPPVAKAPLTVNVNLVDGRFVFKSEFDLGYCCNSFVESLLEALDMGAGEFIGKQQLGDVSLLGEKALAELSRINDTSRPYEHIPAFRLFERHASEQPDRIAVSCNGRRLTYGEFDRMANRIANVLSDLGVGPDSTVAIILERSVELPLAEIGIMKAGGAFLGILPDYPDDRVSYCLEDAACKVVITSRDILPSRRELFASDRPYRTLAIEDMLEDNRERNPQKEIPMNSLAYCIYTSGSTGKPKGVMIEHRNLTCLAQPADFTYELYHGHRAGNTSLALSSISFDMSIFDDILHLFNGRSVCIATDREIHNPGLLAAAMEREGVDMMATTPSFLANYCTVPEFRKAVRGLRTLVCGAEAFPSVLLSELKGIAPGLNIINGYGPSECTATCCAKLLEKGDSITIGGPSANTSLYILDKSGNILPPYACGELVICGDLVGRGYVNLPGKTAESFFTLNGLAAYHSGDVARFNSDGDIEFFGRMDNQVKLRGFRVELDEVERAVLSYESTRQCTVIVRNNGSEDYLAAFFTADRPVDTGNLTSYLKGILTYYMVPDVLVQLESIPLTASGKVDRKALPEVRKAERKSGRKAPRKSMDEQLCELFRNVLSLDEFFADDNFFEMGGTSLSASKAVMQLMAKGIKVEYQDIFDHPTPEELADYIESSTRAASVSSASSAATANGDSHVNELLKYNTLEYASEVTREPVGDVLLTGAVGFLGIHILKELTDRNEGRVICLVRKGDMPTPEARLQNMLMYYFDDTFADKFKDRISAIDADITDPNLKETLSGVDFDTLINCAAIVKHYSSDDTIEKVNVHGVENLISIAMEKGARMIQISTVSVPGVHTRDTYLRQVKMHENELFVIDDMGNKYGISKYHAELKMLEAIRKGLRGKIIRVGNLMGRHSDGEFQINFNTNAFMNALRGFYTIGKCPISHATDPMSFSPIDMTARAIVLLAGTNDCFTAFNADSRFGFDEMQLIQASNRCGLKIVPVADEEYYADYHRMLADAKLNERLQGLVTNDRPDLHMVATDNLFTANVLYRLGFSWPLVDIAYLERAISSLSTLEYFDQ